MKTIYLVRHAEAALKKTGMQDIDRPLTEPGVKDVKRLAKLLTKTGQIPELVISSSAQRALQTGELFAERFDLPKESVLVENALYDHGNTEILFALLSKLENTVSRVMVVGHHPMLTEFATLIMRTVHPKLPAGGVLGIEIDISEWHQILNLRGYSTFFLSPEHNLSDKKIEKRLRYAVAVIIQNALASSLEQIDPEASAKMAKSVKEHSRQLAKELVRRMSDDSRKKLVSLDAPEIESE
ncbi:histidine phosphatase family protein [candidate division KSB1 bacterium]|nr:histidine phosphatase family protein [candidate division KSB1 bacterium]